MNCFCNLFNNEVIWLIIIALILIYNTCDGWNNHRCGCPNAPTYGCGGC